MKERVWGFGEARVASERGNQAERVKAMARSVAGYQRASKIWAPVLLLLLYSASCEEGGNSIGDGRGGSRRRGVGAADFRDEEQGGGRGLVMKLRGWGHAGKIAEGGGDGCEAATLQAGQELSVTLVGKSDWSIERQGGSEGGGQDGPCGFDAACWQMREEIRRWTREASVPRPRNDSRWPGEIFASMNHGVMGSSSSTIMGNDVGEQEGDGDRDARGGQGYGQLLPRGVDFSSSRTWNGGTSLRRHGVGEDGDEVWLRLTQAGRYVLRIWPTQLSAGRHLLATAQYILTVTPGATYAPNCVLCYIPPFDGINETFLDASFRVPEDKTAFRQKLLSQYSVQNVMSSPNCSFFSLNETAPFRSDASPPTNMTVWNTSFPRCQTRICITLQVRRFDAWGNAIGQNVDENGTVLPGLPGGKPPADSDVITTNLYGIPNAVNASDPFGNGTLEYVSDGSPEKYETWAHGVDYTEVGPVLCNTHRCPLIKLVGPNNMVQTWITVRINGSPIGLGNPVFTRTVPGSFARFGLDVNALNRSITPPGSQFTGPVFRVYPADANGIIVPQAFPSPCTPPWPAAPYMSRVGKDSSWCRQQAMQALSGVTTKMECVEDVGDRTSPVAGLKSTQGGAAIKIRLLPRDNCTAAGCDDVPLSQLLPRECDRCAWLDKADQSFDFKLSTTTAALCKVTLNFQGQPAYGILPIITPSVVPFVTPKSWNFQGEPLAQGSYNFRISAGPATAAFSSKLSNESQIEGTISPVNTTIVLQIVLRDQFGNPNSDGTTSFRSVLMSKGMRDSVMNAPVFDRHTAVWTMGKNVTVSGIYTAQVLLAPAYDAMWGSPFRILVHPDLPIASNTLLISSQTTTIIGVPAAFYLQARDRYLNLVSSVASEYFTPGYWKGVLLSNRAPGFWCFPHTSRSFGVQITTRPLPAAPFPQHPDHANPHIPCLLHVVGAIPDPSEPGLRAPPSGSGLLLSTKLANLSRTQSWI